MLKMCAKNEITWMKYDIVLGIRAINVLHNIEPVSAIASGIKITLVASPNKYKKNMTKYKFIRQSYPHLECMNPSTNVKKGSAQCPQDIFYFCHTNLAPNNVPKIWLSLYDAVEIFASNSRGLQHFM